MLLIIGLIFVVLGLAALAVVFIAAWPRLVHLKITPKEKSYEEILKERLLLERLIRNTREWCRIRFRDQRESFRKFSAKLRQSYRFLRLRAQEYVSLKPEAAPEVCASALAKACEAISNGDLAQAEEYFLSCLKMDSKNRDAYLGLSDIYRRRNEWALAEETLSFLCKVYPQDAEVLFLLADVLRERQNFTGSLEAMQAALEIEPRNPKYLDFAIDLAIMTQKKPKAEKWIAQLQTVNPENQKLVEFERRLSEF